MPNTQPNPTPMPELSPTATKAEYTAWCEAMATSLERLGAYIGADVLDATEQAYMEWADGLAAWVRQGMPS